MLTKIQNWKESQLIWMIGLGLKGLTVQVVESLEPGAAPCLAKIVHDPAEVAKGVSAGEEGDNWADVVV